MKDSSNKGKRPDSKETIGQPFFNLSPMGNFKAVFVMVILGCLLLGAILSGAVEQNTKSFWRFLEKVTPADIEKIEVKRTDPFGNEVIGDPITIKDRVVIENFVASTRTVEEYSPSHPISENNTRVKLWLTNGQTIEFECYTLKGEGNTIFVGYLWITPNLYSFGNGHVKFPAQEFYNWLMNVGVKFE